MLLSRSATVMSAALTTLAILAACNGNDGAQSGSSAATNANPAPTNQPPNNGPNQKINPSGTSSGEPETNGSLPIPRVVSTTQRCKLINRQNNLDPTDNKTHFTANIQGSDLGMPIAHNGTLYIFFGDTVGFRGIWNFGESLPDAVGFSAVSAAEIANNPEKLCSNLRFVTLPANSSIGPGQDARIAADFAGEYMRPPPGHTINEYIRNPAGRGAFPNLPGDFEVPSGAFSYGGSIYLYFTTVQSPADVTMKASYLAKWAAPATNAVPAYDIQYKVDQRFDANGPMHGDFINIAPVVHGDYVYLYGTGNYRRSPVHLARKRLTTLAAEGGYERYDAASKTWKPENAVGVEPIVKSAGNGEMSVRYYPSIQRFMSLNQEELPTSNRVIARFSASPEGPWSDAVVVHDMGDAAFRGKYCCQNTTTCTGEQLFHCDRAGFYGTYLFPDVIKGPGTKFTVAYTMSTWDPYNVALMQATFE
jgi:hypothetical protein